jgi:hypothetical protein
VTEFALRATARVRPDTVVLDGNPNDGSGRIVGKLGSYFRQLLTLESAWRRKPLAVIGVKLPLTSNRHWFKPLFMVAE